jgi:YHS domain-containing protein
MLRFILFSILLTIAWRAVGQLLEGIRQGLRGSGTAREVQRGVQMARDPVCGTFVVPDHALSLADANGRVYFCSAACRDKYGTRSAGRSGRSGRAEGRTA